MSLRNIAFHWLTSEYMQLASGFMQLAAAVRRRNIVHFNCLFEGKMLIVQILNTIIPKISIFVLHGYIWQIPRHLSHCLVLVQPRKTHPDMTEKLLTGMYRNQTKQKSSHFNFRHVHYFMPKCRQSLCKTCNIQCIQYTIVYYCNIHVYLYHI